MARRNALLVGSILAVVSLSQWVPAEAGGLRSPPRDRGVAILSPLESPDPCDSPVGGRYRFRPYYPGYAFDRRCHPIYGTGDYLSWDGYGYPIGTGLGQRSSATGRANFGNYTGASKDEARLLHLGGFGSGGNPAIQPGRSSDVIEGTP